MANFLGWLRWLAVDSAKGSPGWQWSLGHGLSHVMASLALTLFSLTWLASSSSADDQSEYFEQKILPVLVSKCYHCHSHQAPELEGGLRLDSRAGVRQGGDSGPAVVPGSVSQSLLLTAITSRDNPMPPDEPLTAEVIEDFRRWIAAGAYDPRDSVDEVPYRELDYSEARKYWAFQPVQPPSMPLVRQLGAARQ